VRVDDYFEKYFLWRESVPYETRPAKADEVFGRMKTVEYTQVSRLQFRRLGNR